MQRIGFKEWAIVCEALGRGEQSIIIRKGGIAEGREGFSFRHNAFFLFPTWFHEQSEKVRRAIESIPTAKKDTIEIRYFARLDLVRVISSWATAEALAPFHIWRSEVIRERFDYDEAPGLHVALVRVFRLNAPWSFTDQKRFGGCRSWVELPEPPVALTMEPVLTEGEHEKRREQFQLIVEM